MNSRTAARILVPSLLAASLLVACGGGGSDSNSSTGTLRLSLTDAPACGYDNVWVTVQKVRVHKSSAADENDAGWHEVAVSSPERIDLLEYTNGKILLSEIAPLSRLAGGSYGKTAGVFDLPRAKP